ncbi:hypothetical protein ACQEVI_16605 [Promicromonospora sp. CA-289599]|uniref:hypothetical protein n=1 Tax=Promicromonospora sp. CA-289599 TaxID=3240014 RepID=UPI003D92C498
MSTSSALTRGAQGGLQARVDVDLGSGVRVRRAGAGQDVCDVVELDGGRDERPTRTTRPPGSTNSAARAGRRTSSEASTAASNASERSRASAVHTLSKPSDPANWRERSPRPRRR